MAEKTEAGLRQETRELLAVLVCHSAEHIEAVLKAGTEPGIRRRARPSLKLPSTPPPRLPSRQPGRR
jgi:hypothetical protein